MSTLPFGNKVDVWLARAACMRAAAATESSSIDSRTSGPLKQTKGSSINTGKNSPPVLVATRDSIRASKLDHLQYKTVRNRGVLTPASQKLTRPRKFEPSAFSLGADTSPSHQGLPGAFDANAGLLMRYLLPSLSSAVSV